MVCPSVLLVTASVGAFWTESVGLLKVGVVLLDFGLCAHNPEIRPSVVEEHSRCGDRLYFSAPLYRVS